MISATPTQVQELEAEEGGSPEEEVGAPEEEAEPQEDQQALEVTPEAPDVLPIGKVFWVMGNLDLTLFKGTVLGKFSTYCMDYVQEKEEEEEETDKHDNGEHAPLNQVLFYNT